MTDAPEHQPLRLEFADNTLLVELCGRHDCNLQQIEERLGVQLVPRGNQIAVLGNPDQANRAKIVLEDLYDLLQDGMPITTAQVDAALRLGDGLLSANGDSRPADLMGVDSLIHTPRKKIAPRSVQQHVYVSAMRQCSLVFGVGPAGTGKSYLPVALAVSMLQAKQIEKIILTRPVVEAGERLGFLPGTLEEKVDPYLRPLFDALEDTLGREKVTYLREQGVLEVAPLAYMRGRTLERSFMILDEAQNTTPTQIKMFLTRLGEGSRAVVTGDLTQVDLPRGQLSGLRDALQVLEGLKDVEVVRFADTDVVRHKLVTRIVQAYSERDRQLNMRLQDDDESA